MSESASASYTERLVIHTRPVIDMSDEQFFQFCRINSDLQIERTRDGDILVSGPGGGSTGLGCAKLTAALEIWAEHDQTGQVFECAGFILPNRAILTRCRLGL